MAIYVAVLYGGYDMSRANLSQFSFVRPSHRQTEEYKVKIHNYWRKVFYMLSLYLGQSLS